MIKKYIFLITVLALCSIAFGQKELTLDQAINIGLENNYNIKIDELNIKIAQNSDNWAIAGKYPTVSAGLGGNLNATSESNRASFLRGEYINMSLSPSVNLNWNLYNGGLVNYQKDRLQTNVMLQNSFRSLDIATTIRDIQQNYFSVLLEENRLAVLKEVLNLSNDRLAYEEIRKEFGQGNTFNILQFKDALFADSVSVVLQTNGVAIAKRQLMRSMNVKNVEVQYYEFTDELATSLETLDKEKIKGDLLANNPNIKRLEINRQLAVINSNITKTRNLPTVSLSTGLTGNFAGLQIFGENPDTGDSYPFLKGNTYRWNTSINVNYLLYDGGVRNIDQQNAILQEEIANFDILETTAALTTQLDILFDNYATQLQQVAILDQQLENSVANMAIAEERLKAGAITSLDYRNIQLAYLNISLNRLNAIYNLLSIKADIAFLVGQ